MRSNLRTVVLCAAALAIPVGGAFTLREGVPWLTESLWAAALPAALFAGLRWGIPGAITLAVLGAGLIAGIYGQASEVVRVTGLTTDLAWLLTAWSVVALATGGLGAWVAARRRSGARLHALTDPLTGLPNRRRAELFLEHEVAVAELGRPLAIVLLDVDGFKAYEAASGPTAAKTVLRTIGSVLRQNTRSANLSAHWGEDRFACLLVGAGEEGAFAYARHIQDCVRASGDVAAVPSVSIGIATWMRQMNTPGHLVRAAEEALQQAKRDGGNRIRFSGRAGDDARDVMPARVSEAHSPTGRLHPPVVGAARSAFVFSADSAVRHRVGDLLERRGFHVTEGSRARETMRPLGHEFDVVIVELTREDPGVRDLVREVRRRYPATRVIGIPAFDGQTIRTSASAVHVDAHLLHSGGRWLFQPSLEDILGERDRLHGTALRALQLSDEVRAKEREARAARKEGEARLRSVVQSIQEVLFKVDRSGAWIALSPAWTAITGYAVETSLGRPWFDFFHADDRDGLRAEFDGLSSIERPLVRREARIQTRTGGTRWIEVRAQLTHDRFGNMVSAAGTLADITERRRAEEALRRNEEYFRALIENAVDVIVVLDAAGAVRYASPSVERVLGIRPGDRSAFPPFDEVCHPDDVAELRAALESAKAPGATAKLEMRARHVDGGWRTLSVGIRNLAHIPAVGGLVVNAQDVTEHRAAERALRDSEEVLFRTRRMDAIGLLAGGVANDFNNLLTAIQGHADLAAATLLEDHPVREEIDRIRDASARARSVTRQLLAFGRRQVLRPRALALNGFVTELHRMLVRILGSQVRLRTELGASPDRVYADPLQIERVLLNLAVNAREAMPGGGTLTLTTRYETVEGVDGPGDVPPGEYVALSIADTGHGIPAEIIPHVFDPFFTTKPQAVGVGLGLSTVWGIVLQSGGRIRLESRTGADGAGTTFTLLLPAAHREAAVGAESGKVPADGAGSETVILVDDDQAVLEVNCHALEERGFTVVSASNGVQAMELLARYPERVDLLLTSVRLPGMDGRELADRVGAMRPGVRTLFMASPGVGPSEDAGIPLGHTSFLTKPFSADALIRRIRRILDAPETDDPTESATPETAAEETAAMPV